MTVCVTVKVDECIVFAADSATTLNIAIPGGGTQSLVFEHGHKVFNLYKGLPVCAMTHGTGNIGQASISMLSKEFRTLVASADPKWQVDKNKYSIEEFAKKFRTFLFDERFLKLAQKPKWGEALGLYVGGYSSDTEGHELWHFTISKDGKSDKPSCVRSEGVCGINIGGQTEPFQRLVLGIASGVEGALAKELNDKKKAADLTMKVRQVCEAPLCWGAMPVQDAIDLAEFLVDLTKGYVRFLPGHDTVGGATDIAVVTKYEGFKWVRRKHYYPTNLNPQEG